MSLLKIKSHGAVTRYLAFLNGKRIELFSFTMIYIYSFGKYIYCL